MVCCGVSGSGHCSGEREGVRITTMKSAHIPAVRAIEDESGLWTGSDTYWEGEVTGTQARVLVAVEQGKSGDEVVGYIHAWFVAGEVQITAIGVRADRWRRGIGTLLMEAMVDGARREGMTMAYLEVKWDNEAAIRLYEKMGFTAFGRRTGYYTSGTGGDALMMGRTIEGDDVLGCHS